MKKFAIVVLIAVAFVAGFGYGRWYGKPARVAAGAAPRKILYWQDPMHPQYKSDKPGIAPDCGMKYLPRAVAFGKMKAMVEGAGLVRRELTGAR